jgi:uncharacterized membrane protein
MSKFPLLSQKWVVQLQPEYRRLAWVTALFAAIVLVLALHRSYTFYASYDQGLFNQVFWNLLQGNGFQSSLTSANSVGVLEDGKIPTVSFLHLGQHFVVSFLLWLPMYAIAPHPTTLVIFQIAWLMAAGVVLYFLARHYLTPALSLMVTIAYFCAAPVLGGMFHNFYEQCQTPLFTFGLLLALEKRCWRWFWLLVVALLAVREDMGIVLFGIGLYLLLSRRYPRLGMLLCLLGFAQVVLLTNWLMPQFSADHGRLYLSTRFKQFVDGDPNPTLLKVLWGMLTRPVELLTSLLMPIDGRIFHLVRQWLPLAFIPALSPAAWTIAGIPLLSLFSQTGQAALSVTIRYALAVIPGLFYGAILWWSQQGDRFKPKMRQFWAICMVLSVLLVVLDSPGRTFYFLIPDSFSTPVTVPIARQWQHASAIRQVLAAIPPQASVSATTFLIPPLSGRRAIIRLPGIQIKNDQAEIVFVDYLVADLWQLKQYDNTIPEDRGRGLKVVERFDQVLREGRYGLITVQDGIVLLHRGVGSSPGAMRSWQDLRQEWSIPG